MEGHAVQLEPAPCISFQVDSQTFYVKSALYSQLYPHQQEGLKFLLKLFLQSTGGLLCDEMGLGKTITAISVLSTLRTTLERGDPATFTEAMQAYARNKSAFLIITPVTIMKQWKAEFLAWDAETFQDICVIHEFSDMKQREKLVSAAISKCGVVIASYELVRTQNTLFNKNYWSYIILDEGQKIKNPAALVTQAVQKLSGNQRLVMTGTPMQNSIKELWSLFDFACPGKLGDLSTFEKEICGKIILGSMKTANTRDIEAGLRCTCILRSLVVPHILRRTRKAISMENAENRTSENSAVGPVILPSKKEYILYCSMDSRQNEIYSEYINYPGLKTVLENCYSSSKEGIFVAINHLRKICNHPYLLFGSNPKSFVISKEIYGRDPDYTKFQIEMEKDPHYKKFMKESVYFEGPKALRNLPVLSKNEEAVNRKALARVAAKHWKLSYKFVLFNKMMQKWKTEGKKALVFCQTRKLLDIIEEFCKNIRGGIEYLRLDGETPIKQRMELIERFNKDKKVSLFLLTTKVGGVGINLTGASRVLIFEPDWNPMSDAQAKDRAVRIGQTQEVVIYRMILADCIEEKIYHRQIFKEFLSKKILRDPNLEKSFSFEDLYNLFGQQVSCSGAIAKPGQEGAPKQKPKGQLLEKLRIDYESNTNSVQSIRKLCLKKKYAQEMQEDAEKAIKELNEDEEDAGGNIAKKRTSKGFGKKNKGRKKGRKSQKEKEQDALADVFQMMSEHEADDKGKPAAPGREELDMEIIETFKKGRQKRARELAKKGEVKMDDIEKIMKKKAKEK